MEHLTKMGFSNLRVIDNYGLCGLQRMIYTVGLFVSIDQNGDYSGRYCFESLSEAVSAINAWDGIGNPPGNWIKYKGISGEMPNPKYKKERLK